MQIEFIKDEKIINFLSFPAIIPEQINHEELTDKFCDIKIQGCKEVLIKNINTISVNYDGYIFQCNHPYASFVSSESMPNIIFSEIDEITDLLTNHFDYFAKFLVKNISRFNNQNGICRACSKIYRKKFVQLPPNYVLDTLPG